MPEKKTFQEIKLELETKFPHLEVIEDTFINTKSKLTILDKECGKIFYRSFNSIMYSNYPGHPDNQQARIEATWMSKYGTNNPNKVAAIKAKATQTLLDKYGVTNPSQFPEFHEKAAKSMNNAYRLTHWKTSAEINCVGKYEACVVDYLNKNQIDFIWKPLVFTCSNGSKYFVDMYLPERNIYVEIKGRFFPDAKMKWEEFKTTHPNSELWSKKELAKIGINDAVLQYRVPKYIKEDKPKVHGRLGKKLSQESKDKIGKANTGKIRSEAVIKANALRKLGKRTTKSKPVIDSYGNIFVNVEAAAKYYDIDHAWLKKCILKNKPVKGILFERTKWEYLDV